LMFILGMYWVKKIIPYRYGKNLKIFAKVLFASLIMGIIVFLGKKYLNVFLVTIIGAIVYFLLLMNLGGFKKEDFLSVLKSFKR